MFTISAHESHIVLHAIPSTPPSHIVRMSRHSTSPLQSLHSASSQRAAQAAAAWGRVSWYGAREKHDETNP